MAVTVPRSKPGETDPLAVIATAIDDLIWDELPSWIADVMLDELIRDAAAWERLRVTLHELNVNNIAIVLPNDIEAEAWTVDAAKSHAAAQGWRLDKPDYGDRSHWGSRCFDVIRPDGTIQRLIAWERLDSSQANADD